MRWPDSGSVYPCRLKAWLLLAAIALTSGCVNAQSQPEISLDPDRWHILGNANWRQEDGILSSNNPSGTGFLVSRDTYGDFQLTLEFQPDASVNAGILIRCEDPADIQPTHCYEINIWDNHPRQEFRTGAIVIHAAPPLVRRDTVGGWHRYEIVAREKKIEVRLNGELTAVLEDAAIASGYLALQSANGKISFRNLLIEEPSAE